MENKLTRKYGLATSMCMVIGTVIGSGVFFRNEVILAAVGKHMGQGIAAWAVGGLITLAAAYVFGVLAMKYEKSDGLASFAEVLVGKRFGYLFGWFLAVIFYPATTGILAWVAARFTVILFGFHASAEFSGQTYMLALFYLIAIFALNTFSPKFSGKFQVSTTVIKIIPLVLMGVVGTVVGLSNGMTVANLHSTYVAQASGNPFLVSLVATAFAYTGWDTLINLTAEIKNPKRNVPAALVSGMLIIISVYVLYFIGIFGSAPIQEISGGYGIQGAFRSIFSHFAGTGLFVFIVISCLGTLNGLTTGGQRMFYSLATRGNSINPKMFSQIDEVSNVPNNSATLFLLCTAVWIVSYGANYAGWYGDFFFDVSSYVPVTFNAFLIPIFIRVMAREKGLGVFNRFIAPALATLGALFMIYAVIYAEGMAVLIYLIVFSAIMALGLKFYHGKKAVAAEPVKRKVALN
ncbi:MAG: APC family permease [Turicibacter sp.]|nr:APC family permease [Turicibacter sp.]